MSPISYFPTNEEVLRHLALKREIVETSTLSENVVMGFPGGGLQALRSALVV